MAMLLVQGAVVTSVGLALATWIQRVGRAVAVSVVSYIFFAFGWPVFLEMGIVTDVLAGLACCNPTIPNNSSNCSLLRRSPLGAQFGTLEAANCPRKAGVLSTSPRSSCSWRRCWWR